MLQISVFLSIALAAPNMGPSLMVVAVHQQNQGALTSAPSSSDVHPVHKKAKSVRDELERFLNYAAVAEGVKTERRFDSHVRRRRRRHQRQ